jgi:Alpha/beta hydrolase family
MRPKHHRGAQGVYPVPSVPRIHSTGPAGRGRPFRPRVLAVETFRAAERDLRRTGDRTAHGDQNDRQPLPPCRVATGSSSTFRCASCRRCTGAPASSSDLCTVAHAQCGFQHTSRRFLDDCSDSVAEWAISRLRPQAFGRYTERCALGELPSIASTSVICTDDRIVSNDWSRRTARDRLGADVIEFPGGHSPYLSRPSDLADVLHALA